MIESATVCLGVTIVIFLSCYCQRLRGKCEELESTVEYKESQLDRSDNVARGLRQSIESMADRIAELEKIRERYGKLRIYSMEQCQLGINLQSLCDQYEQTIQAQVSEILRLKEEAERHRACVESVRKYIDLFQWNETKDVEHFVNKFTEDDNPLPTMEQGVFDRTDCLKCNLMNGMELVRQPCKTNIGNLRTDYVCKRCGVIRIYYDKPLPTMEQEEPFKPPEKISCEACGDPKGKLYTNLKWENIHGRSRYKYCCIKCGSSENYTESQLTQWSKANDSPKSHQHRPVTDPVHSSIDGTDSHLGS